MDQEIVECSELSTGYSGQNRIRFKVTECGTYLHKNSQGLREMQDMAWILRTDPKRKQIGFVPFKDLPTKERQYINDPGED